MDDKNVAPFSLPAEALWHVPTDAEIICNFANGDSERRIHNNIRLGKNECTLITTMQEEAKQQGLFFYPSVSAMASRFLSRSRKDAKKAVKLMKETQDWRASYFGKGPIREESVSEDLKRGIIYFSGRDKFLRPTIIVRAARIPKSWKQDNGIDKLIRILVFCTEYMLRYMIVPGRVECNNIIVDLKGISAGEVPFTALKQVYAVMSQHYIGRVYTFYIVNPSSTLSLIAGAAKAILTDRQKQKLNFVEVKELKKSFALHQLETDLGGQRPLLQVCDAQDGGQFFPFPLQAGPFAAGYAKGASPDALENVSRCLTREGARGRVWNSDLSEHENTRLDYNCEEAVKVYQACNRPLPPELLEYAQAMAKVPTEPTAQDEVAPALSLAERTPGAGPGEERSDEEDARKSSVASEGTRFDSQAQLVVETSAESLDLDERVRETSQAVGEVGAESESESEDDDQGILAQDSESVAPKKGFLCCCCPG